MQVSLLPLLIRLRQLIAALSHKTKQFLATVKLQKDRQTDRQEQLAWQKVNKLDGNFAIIVN